MATEYDRVWSPKGYLAQYYATQGVASDERGIFDFILSFFRETGMHFKEMLEVGCGPTIHHILPFVPHVNRLYLADYMTSNLEEIRKWVADSSDAHNWTPYLTGVLGYESGKVPTSGQVAERMRALKAQMAGLLKCDILSQQPLGLQASFELVTSFYCLECVTHTKGEWNDAMGNLSSLVSPGGWVILGAVRDTDGYMVGDVKFSTARIKEVDMYYSLIDNGFVPETVDVKVCQSPEWADEGFSSILVACAQKKK